MWCASCSLLYADDWGSTECTVAGMGGNDKNIPVRSSAPPITTTTATIPTFLQGRITLNICETYVCPKCSLSYRTASVKPWLSAISKWGPLTAVIERARQPHLVELESKCVGEEHSFVPQIKKYDFLNGVTLEKYVEFYRCLFKKWAEVIQCGPSTGCACVCGCLWVLGVGWGCHRSITPPSGSASLLQWHWGHLHMSTSISVIRDLSSILAFHNPILNLYSLFLSHRQLATARNNTNTDAFGLGLRFWWHVGCFVCWYDIYHDSYVVLEKSVWASLHYYRC